jgi:hypothetical protein
LPNDHVTKTEAQGNQPPGRPLGEGSKPSNPPAAGPHSPGSAKAISDDGPEAGGYEKGSLDHSTSNRKGGYGAG